MRFLATADIHIGRRPAAVSNAFAERFSCANEWLRIVRLALAEHVDAVLLAGDVVDQDNRFFEALAPLQRGLEQLADAGVQVYAVAGNHDCDVLAQLVDAHTSGNLRLLGRGGRWEHVLLPDADFADVQLFGWSFPSNSVRENPLVQFPLGEVRHGLAHLGLLHADRGASGGHYAPVSTGDLERVHDMRWVLGHTHLPDALDSTTSAFYPGSPQGLDMGPGERGAHGPVLIEAEHGRVSLSRPAAFLAPVRYERPEFDLGKIEDDARVEQVFLDAVRQLVAGLRDEHPGLQVLSLRPVCRCESALRATDIRKPLEPLWGGGEAIEEGSVTVLFDDVEIDVRPQVNLESLSRGLGVKAQLARLLLDLQGDTVDSTTVSLLADVAECRHGIEHAPVFAGISEDDSSSTLLSDREVLVPRAWALLHELVLQGRDNAGG